MTIEQVDYRPQQTVRRIVARVPLLEGSLRAAETTFSRPNELLRKERDAVVLAVTLAMYPHQKMALMADYFIPDATELEKRVEMVNDNPRLKDETEKTIASLEQQGVILITPNKPTVQKTKIPKTAAPPPPPHPRHVVLTYKTEFKDKPKRNTGESDRRFALLLEEHLARYPGVPINLQILANIIGVTKTTAWDLRKKFTKNSKIPSGLIINSQKNRQK